MAKKTRTELSTSAINTNLPDNTQELITPTTERAQLTDERESVVNYKDDLGGTGNAGKFITVATDGESLTMVDAPTGDVTGTGEAFKIAFWFGTKVITFDTALFFNTNSNRLTAAQFEATLKVISAAYEAAVGSSMTFATGETGDVSPTTRLSITSGGLATFTPNGGSGTGAVNALHLKNTGTSANDGTSILFTAGTSADGAAIKSTGQAFNSSDLRFFTGGSAAANERLTITSGGLATFTPSGEFAALFENTNTAGGQHCYVDIKSNGGSNGLAILRFITDVAESGGTSAIIGSQDDLLFQTGTGDALYTRLTIASSGLVSLDSSIILDNNEGIFWEATSGTNEGIASNGSDLLFYTQGATSLAITSGGTLQVYGTATANALSISHDSGNNVTMSIPFLNTSQDFIIRNSSAGVNLDYAATSWVSASDENIKENITSLDNVLDKIKNIRCVNYNLKDEEIYKKRLGFIAQDFQNDFEEVTSIDNDDILGLRYTETIPILMKAIQEQQTIIEDLKARIEKLEL